MHSEVRAKKEKTEAARLLLINYVGWTVVDVTITLVPLENKLKSNKHEHGRENKNNIERNDWKFWHIVEKFVVGIEKIHYNAVEKSVSWKFRCDRCLTLYHNSVLSTGAELSWCRSFLRFSALVLKCPDFVTTSSPVPKCPTHFGTRSAQVPKCPDAEVSWCQSVW